MLKDLRTKKHVFLYYIDIVAAVGILQEKKLIGMGFLSSTLTVVGVKLVKLCLCKVCVKYLS